jgi:hypothetical protein
MLSGTISETKMTITLDEYSQQQEAKNNIALAVLGHTFALCEALRHNGPDGYDFYPETGRKYHKLVMVDNGGGRSVHAFIDKQTGEVYKSASWKAPAKGVRYDLRLIKDREWLLEHADWAGGYLYAK